MITLQQQAQALASNGSLWIPHAHEGSFAPDANYVATYYAEERAVLGGLIGKGDYCLVCASFDSDAITVINPRESVDPALTGVFYAVRSDVMAQWGDVLPLYLQEHEDQYYVTLGNKNRALMEGSQFPDGVRWMGDASGNFCAGLALSFLLGRN